MIGPLDTPSPGIPTTQRHDQRDLQLTASPGPAREPAVRHPTAALVADQGTLHDAGPPAA
ncbi:hypothetical protein T261_0731 [Streptomyces lydicus]|nr:hypothetical protein T261_0731 [Streptomyces lydicus]